MTIFTHRAPEIQLEKERTALVLVDIQNDFLTEGGKVLRPDRRSDEAEQCERQLGSAASGCQRP